MDKLKLIEQALQGFKQRVTSRAEAVENYPYPATGADYNALLTEVNSTVVAMEAIMRGEVLTKNGTYIKTTPSHLDDLIIYMRLALKQHDGHPAMNDLLPKVQTKLLEQEAVLHRASRLCKEALPKLNWGASFLDANAITLLNEVPDEIKKALE